MNIGKPLLELRAARNRSQSDIESRSGFSRSYDSRVENGHDVPSLESLPRWAKALEVEVYQLFIEGEGKPQPVPGAVLEWMSRSEGELLVLLRQVKKADRQLMLYSARKLADKRG